MLTENRSAARARVHFFTTTSRASFNRPAGVSVAFG
jgi:hypothetical protein